MPRGVFILPMQVGNGVAQNMLTGEFTRGEPSTHYLAHIAETAAADTRRIRAQMDTPGARQHISATARRAGVTAPIMDALAYGEPIPLWLCTHLWRNGISTAAFSFELDGGTEAALREFASDMRVLCTQARPAFASLARTIHRLYRNITLPHLSAEAAAGPLPAKCKLCFLITAEAARIDKPLAPSNKHGHTQLVQCAFTVALNEPDMAPLVAWQEAHFLAPADAPVPYEITLCAPPTTAAGDNPALRRFREIAAMATVAKKPCDVCGVSMITSLYYRDSPTWRGGIKQLLRSDDFMAACGAARSPLDITWAECRCSGCDQCGVQGEMKRCAGCGFVRFCSKACQRANWPEHRASCRAKAAKAAAAKGGGASATQ